jgi:carboxylate-amine ligase
LRPTDRFNRSNAFSLAVEEELLLVHPVSLRPLGGTDALLARARPPVHQVTGGIHDGVLALRPAPVRRAGDAVDALAALRAELAAFAPLLAAGVHPLGRVGESQVRPGARHEAVADSLGPLLHQTPHCGVAVHVSMPDGETAVRACNGLRAWIPLLLALGANSPYWYGRDSGMASTRAIICNSFPRAGIPRAFADYADYTATLEELCFLGECPDPSFAWWDVRPNPERGTLEIRVLDAQSSLEDLTALVALAHCLAVHEATAERPTRAPGVEALRELSFRAARDGLDARLAVDGVLLPVREVAFHALAVAGAQAAELGCWEELMLLHRTVEAGNGAIRQRLNAEEGGVRLMLRRLADETTLRRQLACAA